MNIPSFFKPLLKKPVAILGYGCSGQAVSSLLKFYQIPSVVYEEKQRGQLFDKEKAANHHLLVYSPGFPLGHPWLESARICGCICLTELDFAAAFWSGKIITITGTNGKSTLTELLTQALKNKGNTAFKAGNIGIPLASYYEVFGDPNAIAVCEVSSFQAEYLEYFTSDVLLWTNFDLDHLDRHKTMEAYFKSKWNLVKRMGSNSCFLGSSVIQFANNYGFKLSNNMHKVEVYSQGPGIFNRAPQNENYALALAYWMSQGHDESILKETAACFVPLQHRLQAVRVVSGVTFWNDSKATNFASAIAALKSFDEKVIWIGGGKYKGGNLAEFASQIRGFLKKAFLIGETAKELSKKLFEIGVEACLCHSLEEAIDEAYKDAKTLGSGDIVFSPGFSSYDMFENFEQRGNFFEKHVLRLKIEQKHLELDVKVSI